jgi:hypothetical protein
MIIYVIFNIDYFLIVIIVYQKIDVNCILFMNFGIKFIYSCNLVLSSYILPIYSNALSYLFANTWTSPIFWFLFWFSYITIYIDFEIIHLIILYVCIIFIFIFLIHQSLNLIILFEFNKNDDQDVIYCMILWYFDGCVIGYLNVIFRLLGKIGLFMDVSLSLFSFWMVILQSMSYVWEAWYFLDCESVSV